MDKDEKENIEDPFKAMSLFRVKQNLPMLLSILREYYKMNIALKYTYWILNKIENFHFIFNAISSQRSSGGIATMYSKNAIALHNSLDSKEKIKILRNLSKELKDKIPSYQEFEVGENFIELRYSKKYTKNKKIIKYILKKILDDKSKIPIDSEQMTIEHIYPQNNNRDGLDDSDIANIVI